MCFGAKDNKYGSFHVPYSGKIAAVKLIYLNGYVTCTGQIPHWSFWGCGSYHHLKNQVNLAITTSSNAVLMPPNQFAGVGKWSQLPGYNSFSPEIILPSFLPHSVSSGQELRCGMVRICWPISMENWSAVMFMFCTSDNSAGKFHFPFKFQGRFSEMIIFDFK